jgi:MerR, DNA binding
MTGSQRLQVHLKSNRRASGDAGPDWRELAQRKLAELDEQIARAQAAREAISHGLRCPRRDVAQRPDFRAVCPGFQSLVAAWRTHVGARTARTTR